LIFDKKNDFGEKIRFSTKKLILEKKLDFKQKKIDFGEKIRFSTKKN